MLMAIDIYFNNVTYLIVYSKTALNFINNYNKKRENKKCIDNNEKKFIIRLYKFKQTVFVVANDHIIPYLPLTFTT